MANVFDIIFCLKATNFEEQGVCATTILTALTPEYIPGLFTFSVINYVLFSSSGMSCQKQDIINNTVQVSGSSCTS